MQMIHTGDCLEVMKTLGSGSIDAIVTDPPYGLSFMGKNWDSGVPGVAFWREALRVAKPGCHILAAGGSRTYHRLAVAIEDAGWEIRDCVLWLYGSGFPKSHNVSKAIDKTAGAERAVVGEHRKLGYSKMKVDQGARPNLDCAGNDGQPITAPATDAAQQWDGWGTALKPAFEPFILARKPLDGTVAETVLKHGTGALNVDGCRVLFHGEADKAAAAAAAAQRACRDQNQNRTAYGEFNNGDASLAPYLAGMDRGRWPANLIHDGSDEVTQPFGTAARFFYVAKASRSEREAGLDGMDSIYRANGNKWTDEDYKVKTGERPPSAESGPRTNHHPTVKPVALMSYLCRLITPPNGTILDPFCGSGSTGVAAIREGFKFVGIEINPDYAEIAKRRIEHERQRMPLLEAIK